MQYHIEFPGLGIETALNPDAFHIGGYSIKWYGIIIALGFLLAFLYALSSCGKMRINQDRFLDVLIVGIIGGIIGARLFYVAFFPGDTYRLNPIRILYITEGGLAIYGGIIGGLLFGVLMAKIRKIKVTAVLDLAVLGFLIGQGIGRWGNFFNQEVFGKKTTVPWRMYSEVTEQVVGGAAHPLFFYESLWCILGFVLLHFFTRKLRRYDGQTFLLYLVWYGLGRFYFESLRPDEFLLFIFGIPVSQIVAAASVVIALILLLVFRKSTSLRGCGSRYVMELNNITDEVAEDDIENLAAAEAEKRDYKKEAEFSTIFGDLGYEEEPVELETPPEDPEEEPAAIEAQPEAFAEEPVAETTEEGQKEEEKKAPSLEPAEEPAENIKADHDSSEEKNV